jgi:osmotically-inducible protein OsmY
MERRSDSQLKQNVLRELKWDTRVHWGHIGVKVNDGVVTLTGTVPSYAEKEAAQAAAHRVAGVLDVANDIEVKVTNLRTDMEIAQAVRGALEWDMLVPDDKIRSTVSNGWVTLEGSVNTLREREDAELAVRHLAGVVGIVDRIEVAPRKVDPEELRLNIEDALERRAEREAERLRVEVTDGAVDLWGRVHSWQEKRAVLGSIIHAPGIRAVNDHLRVDPYF